MEFNPNKISMMTVTVFTTETTLTTENPKFSHMAYSLNYPGFPFLSIACSEADPKIKAWKKQGYPYKQCKWFIWQELYNAKTNN